MVCRHLNLAGGRAYLRIRLAFIFGKIDTFICRTCEPLPAVKGSAILLWLAQGFGSGRAPFAPGTFGSIVGVLWFLLLVAAGNVWIFSLGILAGLAASVWLCGEGEKILRQKDPGSVVMDEIAAIPICFARLVRSPYHKNRYGPDRKQFPWPTSLDHGDRRFRFVSAL